VENGRIILRAPLSALLLCRRIPNGNWDAQRKAWSYPATEAQARLVQSAIHRLSTTQQFDQLAEPAAVRKHDAAPHTTQPVQPDPAPVELPEGLLTHPWRHQMAAFVFCLQHFALGMFGLLLAMGMGTGKTLVAFMVMLQRKAQRTLILCPLRVVPVWVTQLERHVGIPLVVVALDDSVSGVRRKQEIAAEKLLLAEARGVPFVCVINYDSFWREPFNEWAEKVRWDLFIMDEAHRIKAPGGKASLACKRMRTRALVRLGMTGTPMPHGPLDSYGVTRPLDQTIFGPSFSAFRQRHAVLGGYQNKQVIGFQKLDELEKSLGRIMFRVGKEVLDLPPETHVTYHCELTGEAARIYRDLEEDFVAQVRDGVVTAANAMVKLLRLQQVTGGCVPTDDGIGHHIDSSKQKLLADTLEDMGADEPVVVFCRFHADLDAIHEACQSLGYSSMELSGRRDELAQWQAGEAQVVAVQISAGGIGVDLTRARYSINGGAIIDHEAPRERWFVAVQK
jgi:SNF2 family DNA or RNA helicase